MFTEHIDHPAEPAPQRLVIVVEYDVHTDMQAALHEALTQIREGVDRLDPAHVKAAQIHVGVEDFVDKVLDLFAKDSGTPTKPPSEPVDAPAAPGGPSVPLDPGTAQQDPGRTNAYLSAISALAEPHWVKFSTRRAIAHTCMRVADAEMADLKAEVEGMRARALAQVKCSCDTGPGCDGPEQDCPVHGDVRWYAQWLIEANAEVDRLKAEVTFARLAAETGAEKAAAEYEHQAEVFDAVLKVANAERDKALALARHEQRCRQRLTAERDAARATITRVKDLVAQWEAATPGASALATWDRLRAALDSPPDDLQQARADGTLTEQVTVADGYGKWLGQPTIDAHDPPKVSDPHAATKARIAEAARKMTPP